MYADNTEFRELRLAVTVGRILPCFSSNCLKEGV